MLYNSIHSSLEEACVPDHATSLITTSPGVGVRDGVKLNIGVAEGVKVEVGVLVSVEVGVFVGVLVGVYVPTPQIFPIELLLRGLEVPVAKSLALLSVSVHPSPLGLRRSAVVVLGAGAFAVSLQLAVVP